ncbi:MAG: glycosyl hydrolase 115 family protein [Muribaculaceae bacterium]|nr:glycosyl hydrolase 115 family protein [Muribaculaceae bacterium]
MMPASLFAIDNPGITSSTALPGHVPIIENAGGIASPLPLFIDANAAKGISTATDNLSDDFRKACGTKASVTTVDLSRNTQFGKRIIVVGSIGDKLLEPLFNEGKLDRKMLKGKKEKYILKTVANPYPGVDEAVIVAGSDRRGTIYGIYELSEQIGVSPWYDWADVPVEQKKELYLKEGEYTAGEPAVAYRGIFLNDEGPCLMNWVKNTYGTGYGDARFYKRVFELILRLRGNFLWPAMWDWAFYADDPENSRLADEMGVIIGTSHHEPMARNHQEWARNRKKYGAWNYATNSDTINKFFEEGIRRMNGTEDVVTIGMRGDGDEAMSEEADVSLLKKVIGKQRKIIEKQTGQKPEKTPQVWALYKEVLDYYDAGLRVPDDVTLLLCDDNWGNIRRLPDYKERKHPGGWGMYYHVDYVGAPRNSKLLNCTPIQNLWEQMRLTYDYGVDKLWILNVGDLKPMEYPITLFLDMAWNPTAFNNENLLDHTRRFFAQQLGDTQADEATRIFNLLCKYNGRVTPELLDKDTYNLHTGEWKSVADDFARLEAEALRQFISLDPDYRDTYRELILFPLQVMSNLYEMYYAQAMNHYLYSKSLPEADIWAKRVESCFNRDKTLMHEYNNVIANGKWNGMMTQNHIGYTEWHDWFDGDTLPEIFTLQCDTSLPGGYVFDHSDGFIAMEAEHFFSSSNPDNACEWTRIPCMGRTLSGMAVTPYTKPVGNRSLNYRFSLPEGIDSVNVHVVVKSTLAFARKEGHRYSISLDGNKPITVNFNGDMNEAPENIHTNYYPVIARRVVEKIVKHDVAHTNDCMHTLTLSPLDPGIVFEKIVIDFGGYSESYLFGKESPHRRP